MKKVLLIVAVLVVVAVVALFVVGSNLDGIVKKAVETAGPKITQTSVTLDGVSLSPRSGSGAIKGLTVGNPSGYSSPRVQRTRLPIRIGYARTWTRISYARLRTRASNTGITWSSLRRCFVTTRYD